MRETDDEVTNKIDTATEEEREMQTLNKALEFADDDGPPLKCIGTVTEACTSTRHFKTKTQTLKLS